MEKPMPDWGNVNTVIFSKNNPMKLALLLKSIDTFWATHPMINCLIKDAYNEVATAYKKLDEQYTMEFVNFFYDNQNFMCSLMNLIAKTDFDYTMFLSDSDVFVRPFNPDCVSSLFNDSVVSFNCTLGRDMLTDGVFNKPPYHLYDWRGRRDYRFHLTTHGSIYRTADLKKWLNVTFSTPADMISKMMYNTIYKQYVALYQQPCLVINNLPVNNEEFLKNKRINFDPYLFLDVDARIVNIEHDLIFKD